MRSCADIWVLLLKMSFNLKGLAIAISYKQLANWFLKGKTSKMTPKYLTQDWVYKICRRLKIKHRKNNGPKQFRYLWVEAFDCKILDQLSVHMTHRFVSLATWRCTFFPWTMRRQAVKANGSDEEMVPWGVFALLYSCCVSLKGVKRLFVL